MKKALYIIFVVMFLLLSAGCKTAPNEQASIVLPPTRIGSSNIHASLGNKYTFESALASADVVARIEVGNWIAEDTTLYRTCYEATVLQCFKGTIPETFTLLQDGCSTATMKTYPLFTSGNEILVFLKEAVDIEYDSPYWIIGSFTTLLDVYCDANGNRYYADRYGILGESVSVSRNYALDNDIRRNIFATAVANDPIVSEMQYAYPYLFSEADIVALLNQQ